MSLLDELDSSLKSDIPVYHDFLLRYDPKKKQIFAFYEGDEDSSYYSHIIHHVLPSEYELEELIAGCKNNVLKLYRCMDWNEFDNTQIAFFVDKDLSYWLGDISDYGYNVFVTDGYSVENYVDNADGFRAWIVHFEGFARAKKEEVENMVAEFQNVSKVFKEKFIPIMARAVVAKRHDETICLSDLKISKDKSICFSYDDHHLNFNINLSEDFFRLKWGLSDEYSDEVDKQIEAFRDNYSNFSVRGKWALCFLAEVGEYMRLNPNFFAPSLDKEKLSPTCSVHPSSCLSVLSPYCVKCVSGSLKAFIVKTYGKYLSNKN